MAKLRVVSDLQDLAKSPGFLKILGIRVVSQSGDGMFQAGLASVFFFRPEAMTDARGVALALVVMLLPYSLVGPFVGPFLDHIRRQRILWWGNIARAVFVCAIAVFIVRAGVGAPVYLLALLSLGLSRFMLSGLSAALPRVVRDSEQLITANSLVPTVGGIASGIGMVCGFLLRIFLPAGTIQDAMSLLVAALLYVAAAFIAVTFARDDLGPDAPALSSASLGRQLLQSARDLASAVRYLVRRARPAGALATMAAHRFVYGVQLVSIILISRNLLANPADADKGMEIFGFLFGMLALGYFAAIFITPIAHEKIAPSRWIVVALIGGS
ncbi:MAG: MFS transporter, partial [Actinomycetaceae bacterium]|nr:MFS transporter [Actinomycetaceae bacterium]